MPTLTIIGPYRFFFFSVDGNEPPHVHVRRDRSEAKFWLVPVKRAFSRDFSEHELRQIEKIVIENQQSWLEKWNGYFGR